MALPSEPRWQRTMTWLGLRPWVGAPSRFAHFVNTPRVVTRQGVMIVRSRRGIVIAQCGAIIVAAIVLAALWL